MALSKNKFLSETSIVSGLLKDSTFLDDPSISSNAKKIIDSCRDQKSERTKLDAFLSDRVSL